MFIQIERAVEKFNEMKDEDRLNHNRMLYLMAKKSSETREIVVGYNHEEINGDRFSLVKVEFDIITLLKGLMATEHEGFEITRGAIVCQQGGIAAAITFIESNTFSCLFLMNNDIEISKKDLIYSTKIPSKQVDALIENDVVAQFLKKVSG